ncbi:WD40/YVTN/BNR-like repeat-containing protein, partial [Gemmatimonadota bacterium]
MRTGTQMLRGAVATALLLIPLVTIPAQVTTQNLESNYRWRNIGPANMSGRITDIEALDDDYRFVLVASASGGVWKSVNAGTTWEPIFDDYGSASIGSVAIFQPNPDILWVGTGEPNNRNSVAWGDGIYKSTDGGETFTNMGLEDTHQIS